MGMFHQVQKRVVMHFEIGAHEYESERERQKDEADGGRKRRSHLQRAEDVVLRAFSPRFPAADVAAFARAPLRIWSRHWCCRISATGLNLSIIPSQGFSPVHWDL